VPRRREAPGARGDRGTCAATATETSRELLDVSVWGGGRVGPADVTDVALNVGLNAQGRR